MTNREFFQEIINGTVNKDIIAHATAEIAKLDKRNISRSTKPSKTAVANEPIKVKILELLSHTLEGLVASDIGSTLEITTQKASALCKQLEDEKKIISHEVKVPKKGKVKAYLLSQIDKDIIEVEGE